jgi:leucyl-tRNA synthetase
MKEYKHRKIELKVQKEWDKKKIYSASDKSKKIKFYSLIEFPYPSGDGLHVGHPRPYIGMDVISRKRRMEGFNVLYPIGWDAFGLPTENYAIKTGKDPRVVTKKNSDNFRRQIKSLGVSFDWSREINTTDPKYYKWTQWIFLQFFKKGLAYKAKSYINWCPKDKIGLANEEAVGGVCDRCGSKTEKREKEQWMLAITKYAERLDKDLDLVDYPERVKNQQRNWIGKSEGAEIDFSFCPCAKENIPNLPTIKVFTTRPDTLFGVTYIVLAPEHDLISKIKSRILNWDKVKEYIDKAKKETEIERIAESKTKTGIEIEGVKAINPATKEEVPIWVGDYVLPHYGTGAIMAVPGHDERDWQFAKKYNLPIKEVVVPNIVDKRNPPVSGKKILERKNVHAIVKDPKTGLYLVIKWIKFPWITFPMGGIEDGEDAVTAARREVKEETGFKNLKLVRVLDGQVRAEYFAAHKDENRISYTTAVEFELEDNTQVDIDEEEKGKYDIVWLPESKLNYENMTHAEIENWKEKKDPKYITYTGRGVLINSQKFNNLTSAEASKEITKFVNGKFVTTFKLRDWVFSRQRYWGEPIPIINCQKCGLVPVPEKDLPVKLPNVKNYKPTDTGESPLASIYSWVNVKCPKCKGNAKRETDTMPNWAGSSWYYLRYTDPKNNKVFADNKKLKYWLPVDWYNGGMEHTTLHLLYSRFWHKFLYDLNLVPNPEPYKKRTSHGMILGEGGVKMSKSLGNVVNPDDIVKTYGADTLRVYEMFMGPFEEAVAWSTESIIGSRRFVEKIWRIGTKIINSKKITKQEHIKASSSLSLKKLLHKTIKKVSEDIENMRFNTAISSMMILATEMEKENIIEKDDFEKFLQILAPFAPHIAEEVWFSLRGKKSIHLSEWPIWDENLIKDKEIKIAVQINGKVRAEIMIDIEDNEDQVKKKVLADNTVFKYMAGKSEKKIIYVKNRLINIII